MNKLLDTVRVAVRKGMHFIALGLHAASRGHIRPSFITISGFVMHIPIALLIANEQYISAGMLLIVFGLFDTLDGELARLQKRASSAGMMLDAVTDRMKEVLLYSGLAFAFINQDGLELYAIWAVAACGGSLLVSYVKAKGETAVSGAHLSPNEVNRLFQDGLMRFEVRMAVLIIGLFAGYPHFSVGIIAVLSWLTAFERLMRISKSLHAREDG